MMCGNGTGAAVFVRKLGCSGQENPFRKWKHRSFPYLLIGATLRNNTDSLIDSPIDLFSRELDRKLAGQPLTLQWNTRNTSGNSPRQYIEITGKLAVVVN